MLPTVIDHNDRYHFVTVFEEHTKVALITKPMIDGSIPERHLWSRTFSDHWEAQAMIHWFLRRRREWQKWGQIVTAKGPRRFDRYLNGMLAKCTLAISDGTFVGMTEDPTKIVIADTMMTRAGKTSYDVLVEHRFATAEDCQRFVDWFMTTCSKIDAIDLSTTAYKYGTDALDAKLDEIVASFHASSTAGRTRH